MTTRLQKFLFLILLGLIILMIIFSLQAKGNLGQKGYNRCIQQKCEDGGEEYCSKVREVDNCCKGAGGQTAIQGDTAICMFN